MGEQANMHPWCKQMVELYGLEHMETFPYNEEFGIDGPDGDAIYGKDAQRAWKEYYSSDSDSSDEEKPEKRGCKWCKEMIKIYGLTQMTTFPYAEDFGIDGPDRCPVGRGCRGMLQGSLPPVVHEDGRDLWRRANGW